MEPGDLHDSDFEEDEGELTLNPLIDDNKEHVFANDGDAAEEFPEYCDEPKPPPH